RREEAREEGRIPKSPELTVAISLLGSAVVLNSIAPIAGSNLFGMFASGLANVGQVSLNGESATTLIRSTVGHAASATLGMIAALTVGAFIMAALQARGILSLKPITPQFSRINPLENVKNLVGMKQIVELLKQLGKMTIVGFAVWGSVKAALPEAIALSQT